MKFSVGFKLQNEYDEPFSSIVEAYKDSISEVFFAWQDIPSGRSGIATTHGYTDWSAQERVEEELKIIRNMGVKLDLLFNSNCYGAYAISKKRLLDFFQITCYHCIGIVVFSIFFDRRMLK